jgi:FtsP/CotA-like multicopper oxidase with cupredoxin domain/plastocyanin
MARMEVQVTDDKRQEWRDGWIVLCSVVAALALLSGVVGVGLATRAVVKADDVKAGGASAPVAVTLDDAKITPEVVTAPLGGTIQVTNAGTGPHNLTVKGEDLATDDVNPGDAASLDISALPAGTYTIICSIPGHEGGGMKAELRVGEAAGATAALASDTSGHEGHDTSSMGFEDMDRLMHERTAAFPAETKGVGGQPLEPEVLPDGTKKFELTTSLVDWEVEPGKTVKAMAFNGTVPGPTIHVDPGDMVEVDVHNEMDESTAVHFHGLRTPNDQDGVPDITQDPIQPGKDFTYRFVAQDEPAVGMYHSHHNAAEQVPNGLLGAILIGRVALPPEVGPIAQELSMVLNDSGSIGFSLNGKSFPATAPIVAKQNDWILLHYMNEGSSVHPMHLHGMPQLVVAKDGWPLPQPYRADTVTVAPGERYTVAVHATELGTWAWHCHILGHAERSDGMFGMVTALVVQ